MINKLKYWFQKIYFVWYMRWHFLRFLFYFIVFCTSIGYPSHQSLTTIVFSSRRAIILLILSCFFWWISFCFDWNMDPYATKQHIIHMSECQPHRRFFVLKKLNSTSSSHFFVLIFWIQVWWFSLTDCLWHTTRYNYYYKGYRRFGYALSKHHQWTRSIIRFSVENGNMNGTDEA